MDIKIGLWLDPVCHDVDWDGPRPWPSHEGRFRRLHLRTLHAYQLVSRALVIVSSDQAIVCALLLARGRTWRGLLISDAVTRPPRRTSEVRGKVCQHGPWMTALVRTSDKPVGVHRVQPLPWQTHPAPRLVAPAAGARRRPKTARQSSVITRVHDLVKSRSATGGGGQITLQG